MPTFILHHRTTKYSLYIEHRSDFRIDLSILSDAERLSTRDMQDIIQDIYGVDLSPETIVRIIDRIQPRIEEWQNRKLKKLYTFVYVDALVRVKVDGKVRKKGLQNKYATNTNHYVRKFGSNFKLM